MSTPPPLADLQELYARISPIRYGSKLRYPGLIWQVLANKRRDMRVLKNEIGALIAEHGKQLPEDVLETYLESMVLLHYLQKSGVVVYSMMKPELMESLAAECAHVLHSGVAGDFVDVGVWKGGSGMIMKTVNDRLEGGRGVLMLDIYDTMDFKVLDESDPVEDRIIITALEHARKYFQTEGVATSVAEIQANFATLGVDLEGVKFLEGNLIDPAFPFDQVDQIALLRIDCDFYTATLGLGRARSHQIPWDRHHGQEPLSRRPRRGDAEALPGCARDRRLTSRGPSPIPLNPGAHHPGAATPPRPPRWLQPAQQGTMRPWQGCTTSVWARSTWPETRGGAATCCSPGIAPGLSASRSALKTTAGCPIPGATTATWGASPTPVAKGWMS